MSKIQTGNKFTEARKHHTGCRVPRKGETTESAANKNCSPGTGSQG